MSKKELLTESEMRRFMRLANIPALGKNLVNEAAESEEERKGDVADRKGALAKSESVNPVAVAEAEAEGDMTTSPAGGEGGMEMGGEEIGRAHV